MENLVELILDPFINADKTVLFYLDKKDKKIYKIDKNHLF